MIFLAFLIRLLRLSYESDRREQADARIWEEKQRKWGHKDFEKAPKIIRKSPLVEAVASAPVITSLTCMRCEKEIELTSSIEGVWIIGKGERQIKGIEDRIMNSTGELFQVEKIQVLHFNRTEKGRMCRECYQEVKHSQIKTREGSKPVYVFTPSGDFNPYPGENEHRTGFNRSRGFNTASNGKTISANKRKSTRDLKIRDRRE